MNLALAASGSSGIPYVPVPDVPKRNPYRYKQCKSCKLFNYLSIALLINTTIQNSRRALTISNVNNV